MLRLHMKGTKNELDSFEIGLKGCGPYEITKTWSMERVGGIAESLYTATPKPSHLCRLILTTTTGEVIVLPAMRWKGYSMDSQTTLYVGSLYDIFA
ncbi:hypothetical protein [Risungbinella massiliensis]|uniref:hypothetical protein n=1 Tax=Risungbinella massiliensis TaxID=1329796 RepID=UPI0005CC6B15|nr:hypothetical protein [Risungbinella massiliensis]